MGDLLIRDIPNDLKQRIAERAQAHNRSLSEETKALIQRGLADAPGLPEGIGFGAYLSRLIPEALKIELETPPPDFGKKPPDFS